MPFAVTWRCVRFLVVKWWQALYSRHSVGRGQDLLCHTKEFGFFPKFNGKSLKSPMKVQFGPSTTRGGPTLCKIECDSWLALRRCQLCIHTVPPYPPIQPASAVWYRSAGPHLGKRIPRISGPVQSTPVLFKGHQ